MTTACLETSAPVPAPPGDQRLRLVLVLGALVALGPLTIDMYLPALPAIVADLGASAATVQLTLTGTLAGLAVGQLVVGPLSDAFGRRRPLLVGIALHLAASMLCVVAPSVAVLGALRFAQGFGAAAASVVAMAVVRDLYTGRAAARLFSRLMLVLGVAPVLAPTVGGEVLRFAQWRGVFVVLAVLGAAFTAVAALALPETLPPERRRSAGARSSVRTYRGLLADRVFVGLAAVGGFAMASLFAYISGSPFVFQGQYALDEQQFALVFGAGAVGLIGATQLNVRLLARWEPRHLLPAATIAATAAAVLLLVLAGLAVGGLAGVVVPLWLMLAALGLALPNIPTLGMARHGDAAGTAAALLGSIQFGVGALAAPLVGALGNDTVAMAAVVAGGMVAASGILAGVVRPHRLADIDAAAEQGAVH
jgi:MFS transporter, DHA1 family, multidrug resistance protein